MYPDMGLLTWEVDILYAKQSQESYTVTHPELCSKRVNS